MTMGLSVCSIFKVSYNYNYNNKTVTVAAMQKEKKKKMSVPYNLKEGQSRIFHELPSGLNMEVIVQKKKKNESESQCSSALVFVHGSYHAAWCWAEHWFPFFSQSGYDCYALSLLGQVLYSFSLSKLLFFSFIIIS